MVTISEDRAIGKIQSLKKGSIKLSASDRLFFAICFVIMSIHAILVLIPLLNVFAQSFSDPFMVLAGRVVLWPLGPTLETYRQIFTTNSIMTGYINTLFYTVAGTAINLVVTVCCAYPLSRRELWGRGIFSFIFVFTMLFSGGMIPTYLLIRNIGLLNTRWVMLLPEAMIVWNMILARTFFQQTIPQELYESASMDGAGDFRVLFTIVLPLSAPILAVLTLFYAVEHWNAYFSAMMYLTSPELYNIQLVLRNAIASIQSTLNSNNTTDMVKALAIGESAKYVIIVIAMLPVLAIYPFAQKYFIKGIMVGSIKG